MLALALDLNVLPFVLVGPSSLRAVASRGHLQLHLEAQTLHSERELQLVAPASNPGLSDITQG